MFNTKSDNWVPLCKREKLGYLHMFGIACGTLVANMLWANIFTIFEPIAMKIGLGGTIKTFLLFYGSLCGILLSPVIGVVSDALMLRWGRRRIFMVVGEVILLVGLFLMMYCIPLGRLSSNKPDGHNGSQRAIFIIGWLVTLTAGNIIQTPARTICSDLSPPNQQVLMSNICTIYSGFGGVVTNLLGGLSLYKYTSLDQNQFILVIIISVSAGATILSCIVSPEEPLSEKPPTSNVFLQLWNALKKMPKPFLRVLIPFTCGNINNYQFGVQFSAFMGLTVFKGDNSPDAGPELNQRFQDGVSWTMICSCVNYGFQFVYGFLNTYVCKLLGMKILMAVGLAAMATGNLLFLFVKNKYAYLFIVIPIAFGNLVFNALGYAITPLCVPTEELAGYMALLNSFGSIGQQISNFGVGSGLGAINSSPGFKIGISCIFGYLGAIASFFMIIPDQNGVGDQDEDEDSNSSESGPASL